MGPTDVRCTIQRLNRISSGVGSGCDEVVVWWMGRGWVGVVIVEEPGQFTTFQLLLGSEQLVAKHRGQGVAGLVELDASGLASRDGRHLQHHYVQARANVNEPIPLGDVGEATRGARMAPYIRRIPSDLFTPLTFLHAICSRTIWWF